MLVRKFVRARNTREGNGTNRTAKTDHFYQKFTRHDRYYIDDIVYSLDINGLKAMVDAFRISSKQMSDKIT